MLPILRFPGVLRYGRLRQAAGFCVLAFSFLAPFMAEAAQPRYSAIAVSPSTLKSGISWNANSLGQAEQLALAYCHKAGATDCKIQLWARNACVAVATSKADGNGSFGYAWSTNRAAANAKAVAGCHSVKHQHCAIQQAACPGDR